MEQPIDVFKLQKKLKKDAVLNFFSNSSNVRDVVSVLGVTTACSILEHPLLFIYGVIFDVFKLNNVMNQIDSNRIDIMDVIEVIKNTDSYKVCEYEYRTYLRDLARFIKFLGLENSVEISLYVANMLRMGFLSKDRCCEYKNYKYDPLYTSHILGARVMQGEYVCRHASALLNDVLEIFGYDNSILSVRLSNKSYSELSKYKQKHIRANHAISAISDSGYKYAFDITNYWFCNFTDNSNQLDIINYKNSKQYFLVPNDIVFFDDNISSYVNIRKSKNMKITKEDFLEAYMDVLELMSETRDYLESFYGDTQETIRKIAMYEEEIAPRSDTIIKKWLIK